MSEVSNAELLEFEVKLNKLWAAATTVLGAPYTDFDDNYQQAHILRRIELKKISNEMSPIVQNLSGASLYLTTSGRGDDYNRLERIMIEAIGRITRLDADEGVALKKLFLKANRSLGGSLKIRFVTRFGRIHHFMDDNDRQPQ